MTTIFFYSGRGNSLWTAKRIASSLGDARLVRISGSMNPENFPGEGSDGIGIVTPVIDFGLPLSVRRFLKRLPEAAGPRYWFAAVTTGGMPAGSINQLKRLLARKGHSLGAAVTVPFRSTPEDPEIRERRIQDLCGAVRSRGALPGSAGSGFERLLLSGVLNALARRRIPREDSKFSVSGGCDGCGVCARVCPAGNISLKNGRPTWKGRCEQCGACFA